MKLRNKRTGEIIGLSNEEFDAYKVFAKLLGNADWVEYNPAEPLIKDEKIRKAVRAWAEGYMATKVQYDAFWRGFRNRDATITVWEELPLEDNKTYTIAELCGEEEE